MNCNTNSNDYAGNTICGPQPSNHPEDYWAGAKVKCNKFKGFQLPTLQKLQEIYTVRAEYPSITSDWFWSSDEYNYIFARGMNFSSGNTNGYNGKYSRMPVLCVGN